MRSLFDIYGDKIEPKKRNIIHKLSPAYCVYAQERDGVYTFFLGNGLTRSFTLQTMPESLRILLAMISTHDWDTYMPESGWVSPMTFHRTFPHDMYDIGWRTSRFEYCFVMVQQLFDELRGISVQKCTRSGDDSRGQSQSESKENP